MSRVTPLAARSVPRVPDDAEALLRSGIEPDAFLVVFDRHFDAVHRYLHR